MISQRAQKAKQTMIERFGSEEAYKQHMANIGKTGGVIENANKGFASMTPDKLQEVTRKGGKTPRRKRTVQ